MKCSNWSYLILPLQIHVKKRALPADIDTVELFKTNILINFNSVILICLFQSSGYCVHQNWKKIGSFREALDLKVFVINYKES